MEASRAGVPSGKPECVWVIEGSLVAGQAAEREGSDAGWQLLVWWFPDAPGQALASDKGGNGDGCVRRRPMRAGRSQRRGRNVFALLGTKRRPNQLAANGAGVEYGLWVVGHPVSWVRGSARWFWPRFRSLSMAISRCARLLIAGAVGGGVISVDGAGRGVEVGEGETGNKLKIAMDAVMKI